MTEDEMQVGVEGALAAGGWWYHHDLPATRLGYIANHHRGASGWPDIVAVHPARKHLLVLELKSEKGRIEPLQEVWLDAFRAAGADVRVVRPIDYDRLIEELGEGRYVVAGRRKR